MKSTGSSSAVFIYPVKYWFSNCCLGAIGQINEDKQGKGEYGSKIIRKQKYI